MQRSDDQPESGRAALSYLPPPSDLAAFFGPVYYFVADRPDVSDHTRADFAQIRFMLAGEGEYVFADGRRVPTARVCLLGPTMAATHFEVAGPLRVFGVSILPAGWAALSLDPANELANDACDLAARFGPECLAVLDELHAAIDGAGDLEAAAAVLWGFLAGIIRQPNAAKRALLDATDAWLANETSPRIEALQQATGLSARHLARLCNRYYGAPPKFLARKYRALRCASLLAQGDEHCAEYALDAFYDQSHFIREFKHFIGITPGEMRTHASIVLRLSLDRWAVDGAFAELSRIS